MIMNACVIDRKMVDENTCKTCIRNCRHAGEPTTAERLDQFIYGTSNYWEGETDAEQ